MKYITMVLSALGIFASSSFVKATKLEQSNQLNHQITRQINHWQKDWSVPGVAVGVIYQGELLFAKGFGLANKADNRKVDLETIFSIGSISKTFTATLAGIKVDKKLFSWDKPLIEYQPELLLQDKKAQQSVTLRDIFSHQTGLPYAGDLYEKQTLTQQEMYRRIARVKPSYEHRKGWEYTNLGYLLAGNIIASPNTWEESIHNSILNPLQMNSTYTSVSKAILDPRVSEPYDVSGITLEHSIDMTNIAPAGAMYSNLKDMLTFTNWWLSQDSTSLSSTTKSEMLSASLKWQEKSQLDFYQASGLGLGWFNEKYRNHNMHYHTGVTAGFSAQLSIIPAKGIGIIVLSNRFGNPIPFIATHYITDLLLGYEPHDWHSYFMSLPKNTE